MSRKEYLGDGLYAECDGFGIRLSADRGGEEHWVYLEPSVYAALTRYVQQLQAESTPRPGDFDNDPDQMLDGGDPAEP